MRREQAEAVEQDARLLPLDLEGGQARGSALPVEREDALRQDLRHLSAREEARRQARAGGDVQASRRGRLADRSGVPCRLRRLAIPLARRPAATRRRSTARSRSSTSAPFRTFSDATRPATSRPRTSGSTPSTGISSSSTSTTSAHGATPPRSCSRARTTRSPRRRPSSSTPLAWKTSTRTSASSPSSETDFLPITTKAYLYLPARRSGRLQPASSSRSRSSTGPTPTSSEPRRSSPPKHPGKLEPVRRAAADAPAHLSDARRAARDRERRASSTSSTSTSSSPRPARGTGAQFKHKNDVQKWLDIIRGSYAPTQVDNLKLGAQRPPFPYSDVRLLPYLQHSFWFLPNVAACHAMANLLAEKHNTFWHDYKVLTVAGASAGRRTRRAAARPRGDRQRVRHQDHHALLRQAHDRRDGAAVVVDLDAAQPQVAGDLLPGGVPGSVAVVDQESRTATTRTKKRSSSRSASCSTSRRRGRCASSPTTASGSRRTSPTPRRPWRNWSRSCPCSPTTAPT